MKLTTMILKAIPAIAALLLAVPLSASAEGNATLPGGASSVRETYDDWMVSCATSQEKDKPATKICTIAQEQADAQSRRRVLLVQLLPGKGSAKATLVLPFGLDIQKGVTLQLDDGKAGAAQRFLTCYEIGCVVELTLDSATLASYNKGKQLKINVTAASTDGTGKEASFAVSLKGFQTAYNRAVELAK
ncbi:MAG: invasion associated locus B family protein [Methylobacillus sp.]|jgi:invasion protein IalB|nr:invasion associated locus B family protein [Methylobacillus sp.]